MAMRSRPSTTFQSFLLVALFIAGFLRAMPLVAKVGFSVPVLLSSFLVTCIAFLGSYYVRASPFSYRLPLAFIFSLSSFTAIYMLLQLAPR